jgi:hypothetical protein
MELIIRATIPDGDSCELKDGSCCPFFYRETVQNAYSDYICCTLFDKLLFDECGIKKCEQCLNTKNDIMIGLRK